MSEVSEYIQVERMNDWGTWKFFVSGMRLVLTSGSSVDIEWPDGSRTTEVIRVEANTNVVSDHGNRYDVTSDVYFVVVDVRGVVVPMPLEKLKLRWPRKTRVYTDADFAPMPRYSPSFAEHGTPVRKVEKR